MNDSTVVFDDMISFSRNSARAVRRPQLRHAQYREDGHIGFAADRSESDAPLPQGEAAVLTHLVSVAVECTDVVVVAGDRAVRGLVGLPDLDRLEVPFLPHRLIESPPPGGIVTVRYMLAGDAVRFRARLVRRKTGWHLSLPRAIETTSRRLAPRHTVHDSWRVEISPDSPLGKESLQVVDAGAGGVALRVPLGRSDSLVDRLLTGVLRDVMGFAVPVQLQVKHLRPSDDPEQGPVIGTAFQGIGFDNQVRVTEHIQRQLQRRAQRDALRAAADAEAAG